MEVRLVDKNKGINNIVNSLSVCRQKTCSEETIEKILAAKPVPHLSPLEHCWFKFHVRGISVKATRQLFRHRLISPLERSTRHVNLTDVNIIIPETAKNKYIFKEAYKFAKYWYDLALKQGETLEDASYILPLGLETEFFMAGNGRVWFEYLSKRLCKKHVQREHYNLALEIYNILKKEAKFFVHAFPCRTCKECEEVKNA